MRPSTAVTQLTPEPAGCRTMATTSQTTHNASSPRPRAGRLAGVAPGASTAGSASWSPDISTGQCAFAIDRVRAPVTERRSARAGHPDVVELDLEQVRRPAVGRPRTAGGRSGRRRRPSRSTPCATPRRRRRPSPAAEDLDLRAVGALDDRPQRVGRGRRARRGRTRSGTSAAGRSSPAARSAASGRSSGRRGRWRSRRSRPAAPVTNASTAGRGVPELLRAVAGRRRDGFAAREPCRRGRRVGAVGVDGPAAGDLEVVVEGAAAGLA